MDKNITNLLIAGGILYGVWRLSPNGIIKGAAISVGAVIAAKQIPYLKDYV